jgi:hypothetical protein
MYFLDQNTLLKVARKNNATTNEMMVTVSAVDLNQTTGAVIGYQSDFVTPTTGTTEVVICGSPSANTIRAVNRIEINNQDSEEDSVQLIETLSGADTVIKNYIPLPANNSLNYETESGWYITDENGNETINTVSSIGNLSGDVTGSPSANIVTGINTNPLGSTTPAAGNILAANGTQWATTPLTGDVTGISSSGNLNIYVQGMSAGTWKNTVNLATTTALNTNTYNNGSAGVGATLTGTNGGQILIDGVLLQSGMRVLVKNEATAANNGIYTVTNPGGPGGTLFVLTRATDFNTDSSAASGTQTVIPGARISVLQGTTNSLSEWVLTNTGSITLGTTALTFGQFQTTVSSVTMGGDVMGNSSTSTVANINGNPLGSTTPTSGNLLVGSGTQWASNAPGGDVSSISGTGTFLINGTSAGTCKNSAQLATTAPLPSNNYSNGTSGVGATLTATTNGTLSIDGVAVAAGNRILVKNEGTGANNGIYTVTNPGIVSAAYVLTRTTDFNTGSGSAAPTVISGARIPVIQGTTNSLTEWILTNTGAITLGTTALTFSQFEPTVSSVTMGGDVTGSSSSATVAKINGNTLGSTTPTAGNLLVGSGTQWVSGAPSGDVSSISGTGAFVVNATSGGSWKQPVVLATTSALAANTYSNGSSGVGATLTANANGAIGAIDGVTPSTTNMRILVQNESTASHNGIYVLTQIGTGGTPYILTRAADFNTSLNMIDGAAIPVTQGTVNGNAQFLFTTTGAVTVGTTSLAFSRITAPGTSGQISQFDGNGNAISNTMSGDASVTNTGAVTVGKINGNPLGSTTPTSGNLLVGSGTQWVTNPMSGDTSITSAGAVTVGKINGNPLGSTTPTSGNLLVGSGTQWVTNPMSGDTSITNAGAVTVGKINGNPLGSTTPTSGNLLVGSGTQWVTNPMSGDTSITNAGAVTVGKINGNSLGSTTPTSGNLLVGSGTQWVSETPGGDVSGINASGAFVNNATSAGTWKTSVLLATAAVLPTNTYNNGSSGVGATLTATANAALTVDGVAVATGNRILVKNETTGANNGIYTVTNPGSGSAAYVLTRTTDFNTGSGATVPTVVPGARIPVLQGTANSLSEWVLTNTGTITIGTTALAFNQFGATGSSVTMGGDVTGSSSAANVAKINGVALGSTTATSGNLLIGSGTQWVTNPMSGDTSITSAGAVTVGKINGNSLGSTTPTSGNLLVGSGTQWVSDAPSGDVSSVSGSGAFVNNATSAGTCKNSVLLATAAALPTNTYNNGSSGVGATLTATASAALTVDGVAVATGNRILVKNESTVANNGIYTVTNPGSGSAAYVLTRTTDFNTGSGATVPTVVPGARIPVLQGTANSLSEWVLTNTGTITVGTTSLNFSQFGVTGTSVTMGGDITGSSSSATVAKINGNTLGSTAPTSGNLLVGSGTQWVTTAISGDATINSGGIVTVGKINGNTLGSTTATSGNLLIASGGQWVTTSMSGDATITSAGAVTVGKINGNALGSTTPTSGNLLIGSGSQWVSSAPSGVVTISSSGVTSFGSSAVGTPSLTLGTTNAAGASTSFLGSGATIALFNTTAGTPTTPLALGATGSAAFASRQDHTHQSPGAIASLTSQASVTNTTTATTIITATLPTNFLNAGTTFRIQMMGTFQCQATSGTLTFTPNLAGVALPTMVLPTQSTAVSANFFQATMLVTVRTTGTSGTAIAVGNMQINTSSTAVLQASQGGATASTINTTTTTPALNIQATWATASSTNSLLVQHATIEVVHM